MDQNQMMMEYLTQMGAFNQQSQDQQRRQAQINALRQRPQVDTGMQGGGRMQVAASPWAHLANAAAGVQAGYQQRGLDADAQKLGVDRMDALRKMMERGRQQPQSGQPADAQAFRDMTGGLY